MKKPENSITVDVARKLMLEAVTPVKTNQNVKLAHALRRVLAADVRSSIDVPRYTNSAMDGFAFRHLDLPASPSTSLPICGQSLAGHPYLDRVPAGHAISITTGAYLPSDLDTVVPHELTLSGQNVVQFDTSAVKVRANVRWQGEEVRRDQVVVTAGTPIGPAQIALLGSVGVGSVCVYSPVKVGILATGDELVEAGSPSNVHQIYNSNTPALSAIMLEMGALVEDFGIIPDNELCLQSSLDSALNTCDLILITGGAAASTADISHKLINRLGEIFPWTINMRPGRPMRFAIVRDKPVFILPGNPVAAYTTCLEFVSGVLRKLQGFKSDFWPNPICAILGCDVKKKKGRAEFLRANLLHHENGMPVVTPLSNQSSAALTSLCRANCILYLNHEASDLSAGDTVYIHSFPGLLGY